jgi:alkyldihydroxyacetonephosphate synthase
MPPDQRRDRRIDGWGFEGESFPPSKQLLRWLEDRTGPPLSPVPRGPATVADPGSRSLPTLPAEVSTDARDRLAHSRGQGLADVIRLRCGLVPALPDGVCRPQDEDQVAAVLGVCERSGVAVIPWGGGTSVTGGVNVIDRATPTLTVDLERMSGLVALDEISGIATFGPGTTGPAVEEALAPHRLTLGHFPQSWELSTVGGWVATRSSGQESLGYGRIEDMVAGVHLAAPAGRLRLEPRPASAAGPDLRQLVMGSEGRLGIITAAALRVRPRPLMTEVEGALLPGLGAGLETVRELMTRGVRLSMIRLSDAGETQVAMAVGLAGSSGASLLRRYLAMRGLGTGACLMLVGAAGDRDRVRQRLAAARRIVRRHRGISLGRRPGRHWLRDRFRHPYLREDLLDLGWATDTLESAAPWSAVADVRQAVAGAIAGSLESAGEAVPVLCHVSHPYRDGASLYFTFFFRCAQDPEETIHRWATIKRAATSELVALGVTLSHHHGVGQWHAPWLGSEIGELGVGLLRAAAGRADPSGLLSDHVLLDATDRLEE